MNRIEKRLLLVVCVLLFLSPTLQPAPEKPSGWVLETAQEGANESAASPVTIQPLKLKVVPEFYESHEAMPPREPREAGERKTQLLQRGIPIPSFIPQTSLQKDPSTGSQIQQMAPARLKSFRGLSETRFFPADPVLAAGPNHVVAATNSSVGIFNKAGRRLADVGFGVWFQSISDVKGAAMFDPKVVYDQYAGHFILQVDALRNADNRAWYLISVSKTSDATGDWVSWALDMTLNGSTKSNNWADFPGLGFDETAIYETGNMFSFATDNFVYAKLRILKKAQVYAFGRVGWFDRWAMRDATGQHADTIQPAQSFGPAPVEYLVNCDGLMGNKFTLWYVPNPAAARPALRKRVVAVSSYEQPPDAVQKGLKALVNTGGAEFRNAVFSNGSIYTTQSIAHDWGSGQVAALRFTQTSTTGVVQQEITYGADKLFYFYPSVQVDSRGNVIIVFNRSGAGEFVGVHFTGRKVTDAVGKLQGSKPLIISNSSYFEQDSVGRNRWGDYTGIALDADDSVWIDGEIALDMVTWSTQIGRVKFQ